MDLFWGCRKGVPVELVGALHLGEVIKAFGAQKGSRLMLLALFGCPDLYVRVSLAKLLLSTGPSRFIEAIG